MEHCNYGKGIGDIGERHRDAFFSYPKACSSGVGCRGSRCKDIQVEYRATRPSNATESVGCFKKHR